MKYVAWPAARLVLLIFALAFSAPPSRADELQDIDALVKNGQHAKALERVNKYLAQKPGDPKGRFIKGVILAEQNKGAEAIEVFAALSRDYPELPEPYNNLAVLYAAQNQYEKARQQLELSIHAPELRHRVRESRRRIHEACKPGLRQGPAVRFVQRRGKEQAVAHPRSDVEQSRSARLERFCGSLAGAGARARGKGHDGEGRDGPVRRGQTGCRTGRRGLRH